MQAPEAEPEALFYRFARIVCKVFHRDGPFCMLRSGRGNGHFNAALPFAYIHTVIPAPYHGVFGTDDRPDIGMASSGLMTGRISARLFQDARQPAAVRSNRNT